MSHQPTTPIAARAFTHGGVFHADDVFAAALLRLLNPNVGISRGPRVPEGFDGLAFDVGGGEFDHHAAGARTRANGVPYASFGLLWERFGTRLLHEDDVAFLDAQLVQPLDAADNGGAPCLVSQLVSDFNPLPPAPPEAYDQAFVDAATWAQGVLSRRVASLRAMREAYDHVRDLMASGDGEVLVLDRFCPWKRAVAGSGYLYVAYASPRGGHNVQAVPERPDDHSMVLPFPEAWRGQPVGELRALSGVADATFCHASGFLCAADSLEGALALARRSIEEGRGVRHAE